MWIYVVASSVLIVVGAFLLYFSLSATETDSGVLVSDSTFMSLGSREWAGYVAMSNLLLRQASVTGVSGSWVVPAVNTSQGDVYSAVWIGIGGYGESSLVQTGTLQGVRDGKVFYYAWYQFLPNPSVRIKSLIVEPGDRMTASVSLVDKDKNLWLVQIRDVTKGESYNGTFSYRSSRLSAEWIVERPSLSGRITTLADFGGVTFTECSATIDNVTGGIRSFPGYQLIMYDDEAQLVKVSSLSADGSSFTVTYLGTADNQPHSTSFR